VNYDPELRLLCTRIYNDAMAELQQESGERLFPMALLPWWDVPAAVAEVRRAHAMGLRGVTTNCDPQEAGFPDLCSRSWDPLWEICDDLGLPVNFHIGSSETQGSWFGTSPWPSFGPDQKLAIGGAMMFFSNARTITNLIFSGVLERFPKLNFVSVESGIGWIPHLLDSLDYQIGELAPQTMSYLSLKPSEYFRRQIYSCYWFERNNLPEVIRQVGADNIMFETDFPHPVCLYPNGLDQASAALAGVSLEDQRKILSGNAARLYSIAV
jgi:predicted TIM-barrel fold metal-dependent hydrolase